tara:strand:+ start:1222 stop:1416 length:195 start_codon:yes stop_codon:yes gene_type:complete
MPFEIIKKNNKFLLKNIKKNKIVNKKFNTKESAINSGINYMKYRGELPILKNNKILNKNKNDKK